MRLRLACALDAAGQPQLTLSTPVFEAAEPARPAAPIIARRLLPGAEPKIRSLRPEITETTEQRPYEYVEQMPEFPGGNGELVKFLEKSIKYPDLARRDAIEGKVYLKFVVGETGQVRSPVVQKGLGSGCDEEAVRVAKLLPRFSPGKQNGRPVNVYYNVPVAFRLGE